MDGRNDRDFTPLLEAAQAGHAEVCKLLLVTGKANLEETSPNGGTPLLLAAVNGDIEVCELLLKGGSDPEKKEPVMLQTS